VVPDGQVGSPSVRLPGAVPSRDRARSFAAVVFGSPVLIAIVRRFLLSIPLLFVVSALVFLLMSLVPGNVTYTILGDPSTSHLPPSAYKALAHQLALDRPVYVQYWLWLQHALTGDLGISLVTKQPISQAIAQRFPVTLSLVIGSVVVGLVLGVALGIISAVRGGALGKAVDALAIAGWVIPVYWLAAESVVIFAVNLRWLPATGYVPFAQSPSQWFKSLVLPVLALAIGAVGLFAKFTREAMLDALGSEYVRMARANGISRASIVLRHSLKTASLQIVTLAGLLTIGLLIGTVFVETVFALPGMGSLIVTGAQQKDLTMVQGVAVFFTLIVVLVNLLVDLAYSVLSPKVRVA
jgi:peptide/nickel transport system permease protein